MAQKYMPQGDLKEKLDEPKKYKVLLLNDDFTSMDFVVQVLEGIFHRSQGDAFAIMLKIHKEGSGLCGIYPFDIAETKVAQVLSLAKKNRFPLRAVMEEE